MDSTTNTCGWFKRKGHLDRLLTDAIRRRQTGQQLLAAVSRIHATNVPPMSDDEIDAEVKSVRANLREQRIMTASGSADRP